MDASSSIDDEVIVPFKDAKQRIVRSFERGYFERLLALCHGSLSEASRRAGLDRKHLRDLLRRHGLYRGVSEQEP